jgi:alpha-1,6-mannosyltransferase
VLGLLAAGLASEAIYLAGAVRLSWWEYGSRAQSWSQLLGRGMGSFALLLAACGALMAAYLVGWRSLRQTETHRRLVWAFALLYALTLFWLLPMTVDLFNYLTQAHQVTDIGANPLVDAPLEAASDPLVQAYASSYALDPSVYGPAWTILSTPATLGRYDVAGGLVYLKALATLAFLGASWLLERILRQLRPADALRGVYLFAWNPLVVLTAVGGGHNDIVMMGLLLLATYLLLRKRWVWAFALLAVSVWIKYMSAVLLPIFGLHAWREIGRRQRDERWTTALRAGGVMVLISVASFLPFWSSEAFSGLMQRLFNPDNVAAGSSELAVPALVLGLALYVAVYSILFWRLVRGGGSFQETLNGGFVALLLAFLFGAARAQPWHLIWPAALAGLSDRRWAWPVVVGLSAVMLGVQAWVEWGTPGL